MAYKKADRFDLRGFFHMFFAFHGDEFKTLDCSMWSHSTNKHHSSGFLLFVKELDFSDLLGINATIFVKFESAKPNPAKQIFEIIVDPPIANKERDYLALLDDRLATLCRLFRHIEEGQS